MQLLCFSIGAEHYAIESRRVIEVLPLVTARPVPQVPACVTGVFTHRGRLVPLIDLGRRLADRPVRDRLSTRVIVVDVTAAEGVPAGPAGRLGIAAEQVLSLCSSDDAETTFSGLRPPDAAYLGRLLRIGGRIVQLLDVEHLLPREIVAGLSPAPPAAPGVP